MSGVTKVKTFEAPGKGSLLDNPVEVIACTGTAVRQLIFTSGDVAWNAQNLILRNMSTVLEIAENSSLISFSWNYYAAFQRAK